MDKQQERLADFQNRGLSAEGFRNLLDSIAAQLDGAEVIHTGGNIWCVRVELDGTAFALIGEGFEDSPNSLAIGVYGDDEDEGTILKEWDSMGADEDADLVRVVLATWNADDEGGDWLTDLPTDAGGIDLDAVHFTGTDVIRPDAFVVADPFDMPKDGNREA